MRNSYGRQSRIFLPPSWVWAIAAIVVGFFIIRYFPSSSPVSNIEGNPSISGSGQFIIINKNGKKTDVETDTAYLSKDDSTLSVLAGVAKVGYDSGIIWLDKRTELSYNGRDTGKYGFRMIQGQGWLETAGSTTLDLKHIKISTDTLCTLFIDQKSFQSIVYILKGSADIEASGERKIRLEAGKRIMVSQSDLADPSTTLLGLSDTIDDSLRQNAFFLARGGEPLLASIKNTVLSGATLSGGVISLAGSGSSSLIGAKYVSITTPIDRSKITGSTFQVIGSVRPGIVRSFTINDIPVTLSQSGGFISNPLTISNLAIDIVYKAYDSGGNLLERGLMTIYSDTNSGVEKLIPTTFPTSDKDFRFISPGENPYKTSQNTITVSGTVPKGAVEYITVNGYKLKKFTPYTSSWYYYANTAYQTMKEGFNLYEIRFYGSNNQLLSTQLFTVIKEGGSLSGE